MRKTNLILLSIALILIFAISGCVQKFRIAENDYSRLDPSGYTEGDYRVIGVRAQQFLFYPDTLIVNSGEKIKIRLMSKDVSHSFVMEGYGIREKVEAGKTEEFEFVADKRGEFDFYSDVYSGSDYYLMDGKLIVK